MVDAPVTSDWETFARAPIVEAILDLRVEQSGPIEPQAFAGCFLATHPLREDMLEGTAQLRLSNRGIETNSTHGLIGFRFWSSSQRTRLAQARVNGFTVNHLRPYANWATLGAEGRALWERYTECCTPRTVTRIALRYVNRVVIPPGEAVRDYLNIGVRLDGQLEQLVPSPERPYNVQVSYQDEQICAEAIVRNYLEPPGKSEENAHILDIDVFRTGAFAPEGDEVWKVLKALREMKNRLFFAATTAKAKETFRR